MTVQIAVLPTGKWQEARGRYSLYWKPAADQPRLVLTADRPYQVGDLVTAEVRTGRDGGTYLDLSAPDPGSPSPTHDLVFVEGGRKAQGAKGGASYRTEIDDGAAEWAAHYTGRGPGREEEYAVLAIVPRSKHVMVRNRYWTGSGKDLSGDWKTAEENAAPRPKTPATPQLSLIELLDLE